MALNNTGNPVPSDKGLDLQDNAKVLDEIINSTNPTVTSRTGKGLSTIKNLEAQYVFTAINNGVWAAGQTFTAVNQFMVFTGTAYKPKNSTTLPYIVGATPVGDSNVEVVANLSTAQGDQRYDKKQDLATATADLSALAGMTIRITDRGDGLFDVISGTGTANGANIVAHDSLSLSFELRSLNAVKLRQWGVVGGALISRVTVVAQKLNSSLRHMINPSIVDERATVQAAIVFAAANDIQTVQGEGLELGINPGTTLLIYPNVILDMEGGAIVREGVSFTQRMIQNLNYGPTPIDSDLGLKNCLIVGTGTIHGVSDQGSGLGLWGVDNFIVENVNTDDTNGDGFQCRSANGTIRNVRIGAYGRNGMSPTSGIIYYKGIIDIYGIPTAGANPGKDFDSEINDPAEVSEHYIDGLVAKDVTFVDKHTAIDGADFTIKVQMKNSNLGPNFVPLRFISENAKTVNARIDIDASNTIISGNTGRPITFNNVSGGHVGACSLDAEPGGTGVPAIFIEGEVNALTVDRPRINFDNIRFSIQAFDFELNNAFLNFGDAGEIIIRGSNNKIFAGNIDILTIRGASSIDNVIGGQSISSIITTDSGDLTKQVFQFGAARATAGAGASPIQGITFFSREKHVPDGAGTSIMVVDLPDSAASLDGRVNKVCLGFTTNGSSTNTAYIESIIRRGTSGNAEVSRPIDITSANASIVFTSADATSATFTLTKVNGGKFFASVIG